MLKREPLLSAAREALQLCALPNQSVVRLKSWLPPHSAAAPVIAGLPLPDTVGTIAAGLGRILCLGPTEWLLVSNDHSAAALCAQLATEAVQQALAVVDLSDALPAVRVSGSAVRDVLSKGCGLDFHPRSFPTQRCARTRLAQIPVVIACPQEPFSFELYAARSYSGYLQSWLSDAALEFVEG